MNKPNWRKPLLTSALAVAGSRIPAYLRYIKQLEFKSTQQLKKMQEVKLKKLLVHSATHVPYYKNILREHGVVDSDNNVHLNNFKNLPIVSKDVLRENYSDLTSTDPQFKKRKPYTNSSGGSTGEPASFIQDQIYSDWNIANKIYYKTFANQEIGHKECRLWGSERDLLVGKESNMQLLKNWLYNRFELNAFKLSDGQLKDYVAKINTEKPTWLEAYAQSLYELAVYINTNDIPVHNLNGVLASAETMYPKMKEEIESAFGTIIYNRYGSREVGDIACSCEEDNGLHLSLHNHYIEILDSDLNAVNPGEVGEVYVTTLNNYSMPLIRYKIEDLAVMLPEAECDCHRGWPRLERVEGKTINMFKTKDGRKLSGASFVVMMFFKPWIKKFQIVQKELEEIEIRVILNGDPNQDDINEVVRDIKIVMGESCQVNFVYLDELPSTKSGKYLYGISEI